MHWRDRIHFREYPISYAESVPLTKEQKYRYFLKLNTSGIPVDPDHLTNVMMMLEREQKKNGWMIDDSKYILDTPLWKRVIQGRRDIEQDHAGAEDRITDHMPDGPWHDSPDNQYHGSGNTQQYADAMGDAVGNFFSQRFPLLSFLVVRHAIGSFRSGIFGVSPAMES